MSSAGNKYAAAHAARNGPGDARPTAQQIVDDEGLINRWTDKVVLITGASNGIGVETARALYSAGAHLYLPVRDVKKGEAVAADIRKSHADSKGRIDVLPLDLESLQSVRDCAAAFLKQSPKLNVLICNAGVMATPEGRTKDGFETQFGTNHVAHFLLFQLLKPALLAASTPRFNSRVVMVSSSGHGFCGLRIEDGYRFKPDEYNKWLAYGQSKTANIYMANEIDRRYGGRGIHATSLMPGAIQTGLQVHVSQEDLDSWNSIPGLAKMWKNPAQGAATTVWAAVAAVWEGRGGRYLEDCSEAEAAGPDSNNTKGYASHVYDADQAQRLWADSCKLVGSNDD